MLENTIIFTKQRELEQKRSFGSQQKATPKHRKQEIARNDRPFMEAKNTRFNIIAIERTSDEKTLGVVAKTKGRGKVTKQKDEREQE